MIVRRFGFITYAGHCFHIYNMQFSPQLYVSEGTSTQLGFILMWFAYSYQFHGSKISNKEKTAKWKKAYMECLTTKHEPLTTEYPRRCP